MIDSPSRTEPLPDRRLFAVLGGVAAALVTLGVAALVRIDTAIDHAAWDRVATALADAPATAPLLVVRTASRTADWQVASAVMRLDSAGAALVGVAIDLSTSVAPTGSMAELPARAPHAVVGVTVRDGSTGADTVTWPWFLDLRAAREAEQAHRLARTALVRDEDGVVRERALPQSGEVWLAHEAARALAPASRGAAGTLVRFASTSGAWHGVQSTTLDSVLSMDAAPLQQLVRGKALLVGIDDGSTVPTSVGALPPLAILAHDVAAQVRELRGDAPAIMRAPLALRTAWLLPWIVTGALIAAHWSLRRTLVAAVAGMMLLAAATLLVVDVRGPWLPLGSAMLAWIAALAGAEVVSLWQARRQQRLTTLLFSRFVTPALASEAWAARHLYLEGGRPAPLPLPVTVLFLDLRGFTRFSEATDAARVMQLITDVTAACAADIAAHGGLVDDFAGDGIKADFGAPVPRTSAADIARDARHAVACARVLAATVTRLLPAGVGRDGTQARIGIHSGTAVAGTVGGGSRLKYTVVGDVVNVAARLQSVDLPGDATARTPCRIILSADTMALLGDTAPVATDLGPVALSGRTQPVHAFRIDPSHD